MSDLISLIDSYIDIWNEPDASYRRALIARVWTEDAKYVDPLMQGDGHEGIDAMVQAVQERFPRHRFRRIGNVDAFQDRVRFAWSLAPLAKTLGSPVTSPRCERGAWEVCRLRFRARQARP